MEKVHYIKDVINNTYFFSNHAESGFTFDLEKAKEYKDHAYCMVDIVTPYLRENFMSGRTLEIVEYIKIY